jgi:hypothetical protein
MREAQAQSFPLGSVGPALRHGLLRSELMTFRIEGIFPARKLLVFEHHSVRENKES